MPGRLDIEIEQEADGRWIGDIPAIPGCLVYGKSAEDARVRAIALAFRVLSDLAENREPLPAGLDGLFAEAA